MAVGAALQVATHSCGAAAHEGAYSFELEQGLWITLVVLIEVIAKESADGGFHGVRLVLYLFSLYSPYRSRFFPFFKAYTVSQHPAARRVRPTSEFSGLQKAQLLTVRWNDVLGYYETGDSMSPPASL